VKPFSQIYCVLKRSELAYHQSTAERASRMNRLSAAKKAAIHESSENQKAFLESLQTKAQQLGLQIRYLQEEEIETITPTENDMVLSVGGDGTFLSCAKLFDQATLLGLNSDYKPKAGFGSYGALTQVNRTNLASRLEDLAQGRFRIERWNRLQAEVNGELIPRYALNEVYFGQPLSYRTCELHISQNGLKEDFNCSGVLVCTGMGSHAWHYNAGGSPFSNELEAFGFRVLFPNLKRPLKFSSGIVSSRHDIQIVPDRDQYVLSFDSSLDVIQTHLGDEIKISIAPNKALNVVAFDEAL